MVQSSSVLREPSMDEILTSIREIIEENAVHSDYLSNEGVAVNNASIDRSIAASESVYDATLSVDDAMKALADRIGLSSDNRDFSSTQVQESTETGNNAIGMDKRNIKKTSEEQHISQKKDEFSGEEVVSQSENMASGHVDLPAYCASSAEKIAKDVLRPAIAEWLQGKLPVLLEDILREEIVKAIKKTS
ncbi:DUF2497 domain-containing protein [Bartonella sp. B30(2025)]